MQVKDFKLTPTQKKVVEAFENAVYYYSNQKIVGLMDHLYIDGERVLFDFDGKVWRMKNVAYITGENEYALELSTNTVKSLAKKGVIDLENSKINGDGLDVLKVNIEFEKPKPKLYTEFTKVVAYETVKCSSGDFKRKDFLIAPSEQIDALLAAQWDETYEIAERIDFTATPYKFK